MATINVEVSDELNKRFESAAVLWRGKQKTHPDRNQTISAVKNEIVSLALSQWLDKFLG